MRERERERERERDERDMREDHGELNAPVQPLSVLYISLTAMMGACLYFTDRYDGACLYFTDRYDGGVFVFH